VHGSILGGNIIPYYDSAGGGGAPPNTGGTTIKTIEEAVNGFEYIPAS
jgi:hypothetical protein